MARAEAVQSREDLARFLADLSTSVTDGSVAADNATSADLIDAASGWIEDYEGFFQNRGEAVPTSPTWRLFAMVFAAALTYE